MIEAYRIGINLTLTGGIAQTIVGLAKEFATLNAAVKNVQISINEVASGMRGLQRIGTAAAAEWNSVAAAMSKVSNATRNAAANSNKAQGQAQATGTGGRTGGSSLTLSALTYAAAGIVIGSGGNRASGGSPPGGGGNIPRIGSGNGNNGGGIPIFPPGYPPGGGAQYPSAHDFAIASAAAAGASTAIFSTEKNMFTAAAEIGAIEARMKMAGYTQFQVDQSRELARKETGANGIAGLTQAGALHTMLDIRTMTGDPDAGLAAFPALARLGLVLGANGKGDQVSELYSAIQAGELKGAILNHQTGKVDVEKFTKFIENIQSAAIATGFRYGPREILQAMRSGGISASALSDQALFADQVLPTLTLGAAGGGTGLQGFGMQFGAGKMSEAAGLMLNDMGLLINPKTGKPFRTHLSPKNKMGELIDYKVGIGQFNLPPNVLQGRDQAIANPAEFITTTLRKGIDNYLAENKTPITLENEQVAAQQIASRIPGGKYIADFLRLSDLLKREREQFEKAQGRDAYNIRVKEDPNLQVQAMDAAFHNMMAEFGGALMKDALSAMNGVTTALQALGKWAAEHPETATRLTELATALGALASSIAVISGAIFVAAPVLRVARWLAAAPAAAVAATPSTVAATGGMLGRILGGISGAAGGIGLGLAMDKVLNQTEQEKALHRRQLGMAPKTEKTTPNTPPVPLSGRRDKSKDEIHGDVLLDGRKVGEWMNRQFARNISRPQSGMTGFDGSMTPALQGAVG